MAQQHQQQQQQQKQKEMNKQQNQKRRKNNNKRTLMATTTIWTNRHHLHAWQRLHCQQHTASTTSAQQRRPHVRSLNSASANRSALRLTRWRVSAVCPTHSHRTRQQTAVHATPAAPPTRWCTSALSSTHAASETHNSLPFHLPSPPLFFSQLLFVAKGVVVVLVVRWFGFFFLSLSFFISFEF